MSNASDFILENGVLKKYIGHGGDVVIPDGVTAIGEDSFYKPHYSNNVRTLTIPSSVKTIGYCAFRSCDQLETVVLFEGINTIEKAAFLECVKLKEIILPQSLERVGENAFSQCSNLKRVEIKRADIKITANVWSECQSISEFVLPKGFLATQDRRSGIYLPYIQEMSLQEMAYIWLFQDDKWLPIVPRNCNEFKKLVDEMIDILRGLEKITGRPQKRLAEFIAWASPEIEKESVQAICNVIAEKDEKSGKKFLQSEIIQRALNSERIEEKLEPIELFSESLLKQHPIHPDATIIARGIPFAGKEKRCTPQLLNILVSECLYLREMLSLQGSKLVLTEADQIAASLDYNALIQLLEEKLYSYEKRNHPLLYVFARYANEIDTERLIAKIKNRNRGTTKDRNWATVATEALFLSDTRAAVIFLNSEERLGAYAAMREKTPQDILDEFTLPDFGLGADGAKRFDTGSTTIAVSVDANLQLKLFDEGKKKEIKSFPKKSDDMEKLSAAAEAFKVYKKQVKELFDARIAILRENYISGTLISAAAWNSYYTKHPMLKLLTGMVIWQDQTGKQFMIDNNTAIALDGTVCVPEGAVTPAHPLDMCADEISAWQKRLIEKNCTLLMEQVWEPILDLNETELQKRYDGNYVSDPARKEMRRRLKSKGIDVQSVVEEDEFDYRNNSYRFTDNGTMIFDKYYRIEYQIQKEQQRIELGRGEVWQQNPRALNAIVFALDVATVESAIEADAAERVTEDILNMYTAAQIRSFVELASKNHSTNCAAILLDYQNRNLGDFHSMDEFTLD